MSSPTIDAVVFVALLLLFALLVAWPTKPRPPRRGGMLERQPDGSQRPAWHLPSLHEDDR